MSEYITCRCQAYVSIIVVAWDRSQAYKITFGTRLTDGCEGHATFWCHDWTQISKKSLCFILAKRNARLYMHVFFDVTVILEVWNITSSQWVGDCDVKKMYIFWMQSKISLLPNVWRRTGKWLFSIWVPTLQNQITPNQTDCMSHAFLVS